MVILRNYSIKIEDEEQDSELDNQLLNLINEENMPVGDKNRLGGKLYSFKVNNHSKSSTLRPNYDYSSCEIVEDEFLIINKTYDFFKMKDKAASKGFKKK